MFIVPRHKGAQHGLKGQVVLVPSDFKKISKILPRSCDEGHIISLALKRRLSDKSFHHRQNIRPAAVNAALGKLIEVNHLHQDIELCLSWEQISEISDPKLWNMLTNNNEIYSHIIDDDIKFDDESNLTDHDKNKVLFSNCFA